MQRRGNILFVTFLTFMLLMSISVSFLEETSNNIEDSARLGYIRVNIDPGRQTCDIVIEIKGLQLSHIDVTFDVLGWYTSIGAVVKLEVLSYVERLGEFTFRIPVVNGVARFNYYIWIPLRENYILLKDKTNKFFGIDFNWASLTGRLIFPLPYDDIVRKHIPIILEVATTNSSWIVLTNYKKTPGGIYHVENFYKLRDSPIVAGEPRYYKVHTHPVFKYNITYVMFHPPSFVNEITDRMIRQDPFVFYKYIGREEDATAYMSAIDFYIYYYSALFNYPIFDNINFFITWYGSMGSGYYHIDRAYREPHVTHHIIHWMEIADIGLSEGLASYYDVWGVYARTGKDHYLAYNYIRYLLFERGIKQRLRAENDPLHDFLHAYGLEPVIVMYLDYLVQSKSIGIYDFVDVLRYIYQRYEYQRFSYLDLPRLVYEALGIDIEAEYIEALNTYNFSMMEQFAHVKYGIYVDEFLDHLRDNEGAPPILYYIYIELEAKLGNPEYTMYYSRLPTSTFYKEHILYRLVEEFRQNYPLTESKLIELLNKYTNNTSSDFFTYYSSRFPIPPRIEDLNAWINGTYSNIVRKYVYLKKLLERYSDYLDKVTYNELLDILRSSDRHLDEGDLSLTLNIIEQGIKKLHEQLYRDADGDELPDTYEIMHELDSLDLSTHLFINYPYLPKLSIDGYTYEWPYIISAYSSGESIINHMKVVVYDDNIFGVIVFSKAFHEMPIQLSLHVSAFDESREFEFIICTPDIPWGSEVLYSNSYTTVLDNVLEFRIPLDTIRIGFSGLPKTLRFKAYARILDDSLANKERSEIIRMDVNISYQPIIFQAIVPEKSIEGSTVFLYGVVIPPNNDPVVIEIAHGESKTYAGVLPGNNGQWFYVFTPTDSGTYTISIVHGNIRKEYLHIVEPRYVTVTNAITTTFITTKSVTDIKTTFKEVTYTSERISTHTVTSVITQTLEKGTASDSTSMVMVLFIMISVPTLIYLLVNSITKKKR